jgi:hypothetical protein
MSLTTRETWTLIHGMILGALFLLSFAGGLAGLYSLRPAWLTSTGLRERIVRLNIGTSVMAVCAWLTVASGTWIVYPWYRAGLPTGKTAADMGAALADFPKQLLVSNPALAEWHTFGMEWKEHVAWFAPILATAVAFVVVRYGLKIANMDKVRNALITLFVIAFCAAGIAGLFGALITKAAPVH